MVVLRRKGFDKAVLELFLNLDRAVALEDLVDFFEFLELVD